MANAQALKKKFSDQILQDDNVSSVGVGLDDDGNEVLIIGVKVRTQALSEVPDSLTEGQDYILQEVGEFVPEPVGAHVVPQANRKTKHRPVPAGVSVGHVDITAGTASYLLTDGSQQYSASNNHVYAAINSGQQGDTIIQPGSADGGADPEDQSATLEDYVPIENGATVDLAWAVPEVDHTTELLGVGEPQGDPRRVEAGETLVKSGRTTAVTEGTVQQVNASVNVNFGGSIGVIRMEDQIITEDMSEPGDSGSAALIKGDDVPGGLLFAGSTSATVFMQAVNVESESGLSIVTGSGGGGGDGTPTANVTITLTETQPENGNIQATVEDESGNPIEGATVSISGPTSGTSQTNSDGIATFNDVPIGSYQITATSDGYDDGSATVSSGDFE